MDSLKRKAFVIGTERIAGLDNLPGVRKDKQRIAAFLLSDNGGAWEEGEIDVLEKPRIPPVAGTPVPAYDYVFFYFAGHGYTTNGDTYLCVSEVQEVALSELWLPAPRQLVVVDACRMVLRERVALLERIEKLAGVGALPDAAYRARCRALFDQGIARAEKGCIVMFASAYDEAAEEAPLQGGLFTHNLVTGVRARVASAKLAGNHGILSSREAFQIADGLMNHQLQNPEYRPGRRLNHHPFAVVPR